MGSRRSCGILALGWACLESAASGRTEHHPTADEWPDTVVRRTSFVAGGGHGWKLSALVSPRDQPPPWKIVVVTGTPSWAEYWAPVIAALPADREMVVVDRPGFAGSEPLDCVPDIAIQAEALAPLMTAAPGQNILLVGQSYGAAIAALMAAAHPAHLGGLVMLSSYLGESGPTAKWLTGLGGRVMTMIPRDLRNAVAEIAGQPPQLHRLTEALARVRAPIHMIHGDLDDFAPIEAARRLAQETRGRNPIRFQCVRGANHFLTDGAMEALIGALDACMAAPRRRRLAWPSWLPRFPALPDLSRADPRVASGAG